MKKTLLFACILLSMAATAQVKFPLDENGHINFTEVITVDSMTADQLYSKAKLFIATAYKSSKDVTQLNDDEGKTILIKAITKNIVKILGMPSPYGNTSYDVLIQCKEGRYKYEIKNFTHDHEDPKGRDGGRLEQELGNGFPKNKKAWREVQQQGYVEALIIKDALKRFMADKRSDNW